MFKTVTIEVGNVRLLVDVPSNLVASLEDAKEKEIEISRWSDLGANFVDALMRAIHPNDKASTQAQIDYCESIAKTLNIPLPADYISSHKECSEFIDQYVNDFNIFKAIEKKIYGLLSTKLSIAKKVNKGFAAYSTMYDFNVGEGEEPKRIVSDEVILDYFNVKKMATVQSYIDSFDEYVPMAWSGEDNGMKLCIDVLYQSGSRPLRSYIVFYILGAFVDDPTYEDAIAMLHDHPDIESVIYSDRVYQHYKDKLFSLDVASQNEEK